jgi:hypothetical protein
MRATMAAAAALAGGLFLLATAHGPASATSVPIDLKNVIGTTPGSIVLVGGGGRGGGGGGGGHFSGGGGGGGAAIRGGGGGPRFGAGPRGGGSYANRSGGRNYGQRSYAGRSIDRSGPRANRDYSGDRGRYADRNRGDHRRYAERGRDNNHNNHNNYRHRVWRNGAWVWIYGPDYYYDDYAYGGDCFWLRQQAYATGSPYWWSRYNACVGYY